MDDLLSRISIVLERQDFRMCVPPESDDTDIVLEECRDAIESLRQQLAAALAACEAKDAALVDIKMGLDIDEYEWGVADSALAVKPDASALKAHDEALIERCAKAAHEHWIRETDVSPASAIRELKRTVADGTSD